MKKSAIKKLMKEMRSSPADALFIGLCAAFGIWVVAVTVAISYKHLMGERPSANHHSK